MNNEERELFLEKYNERTHFFGRISLILGLALLIAAPFVMGISLDAMPNINLRVLHANPHLSDLPEAQFDKVQLHFLHCLFYTLY